MGMRIQDIPKVELHVHVEGTITPEKCREMAQRNNVTLAPGLFTADGKDYQYSDFLDLVTRVYFGVADTIRTKADYEDITYDYLKRCAAENAIYVEMIACPRQAVRSRIPYNEMIDGIAAGIDRARDDFRIDSRINVTFERAFGKSAEEVAAQAEADADLILFYPHPYIVGLDIAGGEAEGDIPPFRAAFNRVYREYPTELGRRMHASENAWADNAREALTFGVTRIGHGVRVSVSPEMISTLRGDDKEAPVMLEVCPTSNVLALKDFSPSYESHPLRELYDAGLHISINSDDPGLFGTSIGREYQIAHDEFNFTAKELFDVSMDALHFSFAPDGMKRVLRARIEAARARFFRGGPSGLTPSI